jgi:hypothetical protein
MLLLDGLTTMFDYRGEVAPRYEFWLPPFGGCAVYYWDRPKAG